MYILLTSGMISHRVGASVIGTLGSNVGSAEGLDVGL